MTRLPSFRPDTGMSMLRRAGFEVVRIRGSHYQLLNPAANRRVTVPRHGRDLTQATLASIIRQSGLTRDEFAKLL
jgi:predicted RNA binding protein YcfA (HicA-like mRNA interferase family)